jgi:hypothetical protein
MSRRRLARDRPHELNVMSPEVEALKMYIHSLEIRLVKLEQAVKFGGLLLGIVPTALQLYQIFKH